MNKIDIIYELYLWSHKYIIISYSPFSAMRRNSHSIALSQQDFKVEFYDTLVRNNITEDMAYDRLRPAIHFLVSNNMI